MRYSGAEGVSICVVGTRLVLGDSHIGMHLLLSMACEVGCSVSVL